MKSVDILLADTTTLRDGILYDKNAVKQLYESLNVILKKAGKIYIQDGFTLKKPFIIDLNKVIAEVYDVAFDEITGILTISEISDKNSVMIENSSHNLRVSCESKIRYTSSFRNEALEGILEGVDRSFYIALR